jgi:hypothetical protein
MGIGMSTWPASGILDLNVSNVQRLKTEFSRHHTTIAAQLLLDHYLVLVSYSYLDEVPLLTVLPFTESGPWDHQETFKG